MADQIPTTPTPEAPPAAPAPKPNAFQLMIEGKAPGQTPPAEPAPEPQPDAGATPPEPAATTPPAPDAADEARTRSWDDILRRDREVTEAAGRLKAELRELEQLRGVAQLARTDPLKAIQMLGMNETTVLDAMISRPEGQQPAPRAADPAALEQKIAGLEAKLDAKEAERDQRDYILKEIQRGDHEMLRLALDQPGNTVHRDVLDEAAEEFHKTKRMPDYAEIVKRIEDRYTTQAFGLTEFLLRAKKVSSRFAQPPPPASTPSPPAGSEPAKPRSTSATLSNDMNHTPPSTSSKPLTLEEKRARFNEAMKQMWKETKRQ